MSEISIMSWVDMLKNNNNKEIIELKKEIKIKDNNDNEPKPEDFFKDFDEEFDNKYNLNIFDIYFDLKEELKKDSLNYKIDYDNIYDIIYEYSKQSKKLNNNIEFYNKKIVEYFENEELENEESDF